MGYEVHHTIIVSCHNERLLRKTWKEAKYFFEDTAHYISNITPPANNGLRSYFIAPDGSMKGWNTSIKGWNSRKKFVTYLKELKPYPPAWVLVQFNDDSLQTLVLDSSDHFNPKSNCLGNWTNEVPKPQLHYD